MARTGKIKRLGLTTTELEARFPDALTYADWQLDDMHERGEVEYVVTSRNKLQCHVALAWPIGLVRPLGAVWSKRATWHDDAKTWVRYTVAFRWRGNYHVPPIQAGSLLYVMRDGTVRARPPRFGVVVPIGVALSAPTDGAVNVLITSPTILPAEPGVSPAPGMVVMSSGHIRMPVSRSIG